MDARDAYEIAIGSIFVIFIGWHLTAIGFRARKRVESWVHKNICQTTITKRHRGSTDYTVASVLAIVVLLVGNGVATFYRAGDPLRLESRLGELASLNLVPLFIAGRTMFVVQLLCGISARQYSILHRWLGWVCLAQLSGFLYLSMARQGWHVDHLSIALLSSLAVLSLTSILYLRRRYFDSFLKIHLLLSLALSAGLSIRMFPTNGNGRPRIFLAVAFGLWLAQKVYLVYLWLRLNILVAGHNEVTISHFDHSTLKVNAMLLEITLSRPLQLHYGQYVHITVPSIPHTLIGRLQSHPYLIAWADGGVAEPSRHVSLLIECRSGFSDRLRLCRSPTAVSFHGPYGSSQSLEIFDKVLFMASGIGVAAHLLAAKRLLQAHNAQTSRVRRVSLLWFLEAEEQELWARNFLDALMDLDRRRIFTVVMYRPFAGKNLAATAPGQVVAVETKDRLYRVNGALDVPWFISKEWTAEAGTMAVSRRCHLKPFISHGLTVLVVCGTPMFEQRVRRALRSMAADITLMSSDFQIDESEDSHTASFRFRNVPKSTPID